MDWFDGADEILDAVTAIPSLDDSQRKRRKLTMNDDNGNDTTTNIINDNLITSSLYLVSTPSTSTPASRIRSFSAPIPHKLPIAESAVTEEEVLASERERGFVHVHVDSETDTKRTACTHEVAFPPNFPEDRRQHSLTLPTPTTFARTYPFNLDPFQRESVKCIDAGESVLVSAHTSAGKTAVAEYAIALSLKSKSRVLYTSPIKALSNQKFRELSDEFQDVGLMTGDTTINPTASCLVMTTEIMRSMLYRGSEILREVTWVIFDEIHYMRDKERGVVWEETIIMTPKSVRFVFLSATIPNAYEFASWISTVHNQPTHVVYTEYRPTPLQHYLYPEGGQGLHLVVDELGAFRDDNFQKALACLSDQSGDGKDATSGGMKKGGRGKPVDGLAIYRIIKMLIDRNYDPIIIFAFSKKDCEMLATKMSKLDCNTNDEKILVETVFNNALSSLSDDDRKLPQIENILPLLKRGIGIHHGGLLPLLKEVVEILFQEGLIKCLFATETFSMGLNMPAKTVVFTSVRKFDGDKFRWISGGEYIQMSGRAGRRGLDERGIVVLMIDTKMEPAIAKGMLKGVSDPLNSTFHLGYNMLLNLLRVEEADPDIMIGQSFFQFQSARGLPALKTKMQNLIKERDSIVIPDELVISECYYLKENISMLEEQVREIMMTPKYALPFIQSGRLVKVRSSFLPLTTTHDTSSDAPLGSGLGVIINFKKIEKFIPGPISSSTTVAAPVKVMVYMVDVLVNTIIDPNPEKNKNKNHVDDEESSREGINRIIVSPTFEHPSSQVLVLSVNLQTQIEILYSIKINLPKDLRESKNKLMIQKTLIEILKRFNNSASTIPRLDGEEHMDVTSHPTYPALASKLKLLQSQYTSNEKFHFEQVSTLLQQYQHKLSYEHQLQKLGQSVKLITSGVLQDDLRAMKRVLRRLDHINNENIIQVKGRIACEVNTADELLITEMMFTGLFNDLTPYQIAALLSCLVCDEKEKSNNNNNTNTNSNGIAGSFANVRSELQQPLFQLQEAARRIAKICQECKIDLDINEYVASFKTSMMDVVYEWCLGAKFIEIVKMTSIFEGNIIRIMRRLEELLRQLSGASKSVGNDDLDAKFQQAGVMLRRDIAFASSLYL